MSGDYTRFTFNPFEDHFGVLMQQGRVMLDADFNAWFDTLGRQFRVRMLDTVGRCVVPRETPEGFRIQIVGNSLTIGRGRAYVHGLLAENHGADDQGVPVENNNADALEYDPILEEQRGVHAVAYESQPYLPNAPDLFPVPPDGGPHLVYLDVWQREVTHVQEPDLVEKAVGVDSATRVQIVWQVKVLPNLPPGTTCATPDEDIPDWLDIIQPPAGRLTTAAVGVPASDDPCIIGPAGGFRGTENRLYRVEVHTGGPVATATFKWSRDNASVKTSVVGINGARDVLTVSRIGRDAVRRFAPDDWIEIIDDHLELAQQPGAMRKVLIVDEVNETITLDAPLPAGMFNQPDPGARHTRIRRWDQKGQVLDAANNVIDDVDTNGGLIQISAGGGTMVLEDGVQVTFTEDPAGGVYRTGDYWVFAARTVDASVEKLVAAPPRGIIHHYCRLALVTFPDQVDDCRTFWPPEFGDAAEGCCTAVVRPGEDIQAAIDSLPPEFGGCVCLKPGVHEVTTPVQILTPNVTLRGESHGALLRNTGPGPVLQIGAVGNSVFGIHITTLHLEHTNISSILPAAVQLRSVLNSVIEGCQIIAATQDGSIGVVLADCTDVAVRHCQISGADLGIWADIGGELLTLFDNRIEANESVGIAGIIIARVVGQAIIRQNQITNYANGIIIDAVPFGSERFSNATGSIIEDNTIELGGNNDGDQAGINTACSACAISGNHISLAGSQVGIWVTGIIVKVSDNIIDLLPGIDADDSIGIEIGQEDNPATASVTTTIIAQANSITGADIGITATSVNDLKIIDNTISASRATDQIGLQLEGNDNSEITGNRIRETGFAISTVLGRTSQIQMNQIEACAAGIFCDRETGVSVGDNRIEECLSGAILFLSCFARCAVTGNRISNVGTAGVSFAVGGLFILGEFHVESNEILNTGLPLDGDLNTNSIIGILAVFVLEAQIESNLVSYSNVLAVFRSQEDRALFLQGLFEFVLRLAEQTVRLGFAAQITNNKFIGVGRTALVQLNSTSINDNMSIRFERVFFNHNYCDHYGGSADNDNNATVKLTGFRIVVMGNQIKALNSAHASIDFDGRPGPCMGNVTASSIIRHPDFPIPNNEFNMIA